MDTRPEAYFLSPASEGDDLAFRAAARLKSEVTPLVDGIPTYRAIEEAIAGAKASVSISLWVFNPDTPLQSSKLRTTGVTRWKHLLRAAAERGVEVRLLLTDFDPIFQHGLHRNAWRSHRALVDEARKLGAKVRPGFQVACSLHGATVSGVLLGTVLAPLATRATADLGAIVADLNKLVKAGGPKAGAARFLEMPGLWPAIEYVAKGGTYRVVTNPPIRIHPASHHQKLYLIDGTVAFCGGLDVNTGRLDRPQHDGALWHDLHCRVEGPAVADLERAFVTRWNAERTEFEAFVRTANSLRPPFKLDTTPTSAATTARSAPAAKGTALTQVLRTVSVDAALSVVPRNVRRDIEESYQLAIEQAAEYVYVENQYLRWLPLADWLVARRGKAPGLRLIVVVPVAPEEVAGPGGGDEITKHGLHLQHEAITRLKAAFGANMGVYSLIANAPAPGKHATNMYGSMQIYVHSKAMLVDDAFAHVGSANTNGRSFRVDTELGVSWLDKASVTRFRLTLWNELLGAPKGLAGWKPADFVTLWDKIAKANVKAAPGGRSGFVVPHDLARFPGAASGRVPDELAGLTDTDPAGEDASRPA